MSVAGAHWAMQRGADGIRVEHCGVLLFVWNLILTNLEWYSTPMEDVESPDRGPRRPPQDRSPSRIRIAAEARRLFLDRGYAGTTIEAIAESARVAIQTIYNTVGLKSAILELVLETTAAGPGAPNSVRDLMQQRTDQAETAEAVIAILGDWFVEVHERTAEVFRVISEGAAVDPEIGALDRRRATQRLENYRLAAAEIAHRLPHPPNLDRDATAAVIWSVGHPQTYRFLVLEQSWDVDRYRDWVVATLTAALLYPGRSTGEPSEPERT
jgi:AcrR family transcriptional regulator